jgi:integrase/recombinase XerD
MKGKYSKEWLRPDELKKLLSLPGIAEKYEIWILLMYTPALRVTEAINIRLRDLDVNNQCVEIWGGKGYDETELRKAPCDLSTMKKIIRYAEHNNLKPRDYIMFSNKSKQVDRSQVYRVVNQLCEQAGIDKRIGTHTFRRSRAEHLLDRGLPITFVSKYLHHRNLSTTMKYLDVSVSDIQREMEKIQDPIVAII